MCTVFVTVKKKKKKKKLQVLYLSILKLGSNKFLGSNTRRVLHPKLQNTCLDPYRHWGVKNFYNSNKRWSLVLYKSVYTG